MTGASAAEAATEPNPEPWQPTPLRNEGAPDVSWRSRTEPSNWQEPAAAAAAPEPTSWLENRTAKISDEMMRSAVAGFDAERMPAEPPAPAPAAPPAMGDAAASAPAERELSDAEVDRIAHRVAAILGERVVRDVSWEVIPDLAELIIKDRIRELEAQVE